MKIAMLLSGGVDSSVALNLLKEQGHDMTAFYLKIWLEDELAYLGDCPWEQDLDYAQKVCTKINVPLKVINLQNEYFDQVVSYAISEVKNGRTPSPDIFCNNKIKFGVFYEKIGTEFEKIASGHYAQIEKQGCKYLLKKSPDLIKDQPYFLSHLNQKQLSKAMFPIGHLTKEKVRQLAHKYDLPTKNRKDSQGICFLGKIKFSDFIKHHLGIKKGDLIEYETNNKIGEHDGFWYYTTGQRKKIGLSGGPWYVVEKNTQKNIVYVSNKYFSIDKKRDKFKVTNFHWISGKKPTQTNLQVKIRHGKELYNCSLKFLDKNSGIVKLDQNDQGLAPGQFAIFYNNEYCLGCAIIV